MNRILIVGAPRSGTTWLANALSATPGARLAHEPDNTAFNADALESMELYGGYAAPHVGERVPAYERLWDPAFLAPPFAPVHLIVKSVFAAFAMDWLIDRYQPRVVLIERHPLRVVSSWMRLGFRVGDLATRERIQTEYVERLR
ncbi:MAG: sulfotransferase, partial [Candidatus Dormibacteraeota bacterium]|nr:sulfotransferase [Candidatus Dormibacteraeota bacterium]